MRSSPVLLVVFVLALSGCMSIGSRNSDPMKMSCNEAEMRSEVFRFISVGLPIEEAKEIMEKHGFDCSFEREWGTIQKDAASGQFCLVCSKYTPESTWVASNKIYVYALFEGGAVTDIVIRRVCSCL
jgi:hypothetical protein